MNRNRNNYNDKRKNSKTRSNRNHRDRSDGVSKRDKDYDPKLDAEGRPNDPNYYFFDRNVAEQVSQLSFQQLGGVPLHIMGYDSYYPTVKVRHWNPSAGVETYSSGGLAQTGINMAGLRLFTKLSAYTGRKAEYGPQDISTMILALGELISVVEHIRRVFGVAFLGSETNRTYPRALLTALRVEPEDFYEKYASYRNRFNKLITLVNQIPIPQNIAYFDKCAHMYEKLYLDADSPLATVIADVPATIWRLNEAAYDGGSILETCNFTIDRLTGERLGAQNMSYFLDWLENLIGQMLNSSTLQIVYTDLLNLATKINTKFWKFEYLADGYLVVPEYNPKYLLMMHNSIVTGAPHQYQTYDAETAVNNTPLNDVYPDPENNNIMYNPSFDMLKVDMSGEIKWTRSVPDELIVDMMDPNPTVEDRIEVIRWMAMSDENVGGWTPDGGTTYLMDQMVLSDHYVVAETYWSSGTVAGVEKRSLDVISNPLRAVMEKVTWNNLHYEAGPVTDVGLRFKGDIVGDLNYFTKIRSSWLRPIFDFTALALYDMRQ